MAQPISNLDWMAIIMTVLVTGVAGFIGSHVAEHLLKRGDTVVGIDNFEQSYSVETKVRNLNHLTHSEDFTFQNADIKNLPEMQSLFQQRDIQSVVHLAAKAGVRPSFHNPADYIETNVIGTSNLLQSCVSSNVKHLVFASSSSVYGNRESKPFSESDSTDSPVSPYAATKKSGEQLCHVYHSCSDLQVSCLRLFTAYGPRQRPDLAIHKFADLLAQGLPIPFFGDGDTSRDYTYVDDIVFGVVSALDQPNGFQIYNIGSGNPVNLRTMVDSIAEAIDTTAELEFLPAQDGDVQSTYADITKARTMLGYEPKTTFAEGIQRFATWYWQQSRGNSRSSDTIQYRRDPASGHG